LNGASEPVDAGSCHLLSIGVTFAAVRLA